MFNLRKLKNGLTLVTAPIEGTKTITALVMVGTGSRYEEKQLTGISHFLEHMFFKGTKKRPTTKILSSEMDSTGGDFNAFTSKEATGFWMKVDASKTETALDIVSDMLLNSKFDKAEIEREKGVIIEEINMYADNPMMYIEDVFEECLYGDTPAGRDTSGTKEAVSKFKREDFIRYFTGQYKPENSVICLAGDIKPGTIKKVEKYFTDFAVKHERASFKEKEIVTPNQTAPALKINYKKTDQAHLSLGVHTYPHGHPDEMTLKLLSIILGGSMSSRLFIELRERRGLAYYIRTSVESYSDSGYLSTQAGVKMEKIDEAIKVILKEYKKIRDELVMPTELQRVKDLIKGKIVIQLESSDDVAEWYGRQVAMMLTQSRSKKQGRETIYSPEEFIKKINKVTAKDIKRVANEIFKNNNLNLAVIGPYKDENKFKKLLKF